MLQWVCNNTLCNKYLPFVEKYKTSENLEISNYATVLAEGIKQLLSKEITIDDFVKIGQSEVIDGFEFDIGCLNHMYRVVAFTE